MSERRTIVAAVLAVAVTSLPSALAGSAQDRQLEAVLEKSARYVAEFRRQLSEIVAEETYRQDIANTSRIGGPTTMLAPTRVLKSDLLLVKPSDAERHVELRDVFEVDGNPVRDREARLELLLRDPRAGARIGAIIEESARYNIGSIQRNINTPLMALQFLDRGYQGRFRFTHVEKARPVFTASADQAINDTPVFRVSTEMWTVEYRERDRNTVIKRPNGGDLPAHGRFWIDPTTGAVLISEMIVDGGGVIATVTVSYQSEPLMGFMVPIEMRESYVRDGERISGHAQYGRFRLLKQ